MCLIINKPAGLTVPTRYIKAAYNNNKDGFGLMWAEDGRIQTVKGLLTLDQIKWLLASKTNQHVVMHFRHRTVGTIDVSNVHPFQILDHDLHGEDLFMMHNGTMFEFKDTTDMSDSQQYANQLANLIKHAGPNLVFQKRHRRSLAAQIGKSNKILYLRGNGQISIVNKGEGATIDGCWYSNLYSLEPNFRKLQRSAEHWENYITSKLDESKNEPWDSYPQYDAYGSYDNNDPYDLRTYSDPWRRRKGGY